MAQEQPINYSYVYVLSAARTCVIRYFEQQCGCAAYLPNFLTLSVAGSSGLPGTYPYFILPRWQQVERFKLIDVSDVTTARVMYAGG